MGPTLQATTLLTFALSFPVSSPGCASKRSCPIYIAQSKQDSTALPWEAVHPLTMLQVSKDVRPDTRLQGHGGWTITVPTPQWWHGKTEDLLAHVSDTSYSRSFLLGFFICLSCCTPTTVVDMYGPRHPQFRTPRGLSSLLAL